jgi:hypothetical protein
MDNDNMDTMTFGEFKYWLEGFIFGKGGVTPTDKDWETVHDMMSKVVPDKVIEKDVQVVRVPNDIPTPHPSRPYTYPYMGYPQMNEPYTYPYTDPRTTILCNPYNNTVSGMIFHPSITTTVGDKPSGS